jgi:hypothetical protein
MRLLLPLLGLVGFRAPWNLGPEICRQLLIWKIDEFD